MSDLLSVVIPARNEPYLQKTIDSLLIAAECKIEVVAILDGYWPDPPIQDNPFVKQIHFSESKGMRAAINAGARVAQGKYLMKCDAHCLFDKGFDVKLAQDCRSDWTIVPRRYRLNVERWEPILDKPYDFQYIRKSDLKGKDWPEYGERALEGQYIFDLLTSQGSCWFMYKDRFWELGGLDEVNYGSMGKEAQEICLKSWLSDGRYALNRNVWYAHWAKDTGLYKDVKEEKRKSAEFALDYWTSNKWPVQKHNLDWLIGRFAPVPTWDNVKEEKEMVMGENTEQHLKAVIAAKSIRVIKKKGLNRAGLYRYFASLGFKTGAEIGVQRGRNAWVMLENIPNLKLYLIDPYKDNKDTQRQWGDKLHTKACKIAHNRLDGRNVVFIEKSSIEASVLIPDGSLDFVHIDGDHSYNYVTMDTQIWSRKVRKGGVVSGHDYHFVKSRKFKVTGAINDFASANGLTIFITDEEAKELPGDGYASWFWVKE